MAFGFLNALMLAGLAAVALPILAHLLSKRRFDVVQWGAMQFLELGQRTRRRIRIQDLLLLLLRMGLVACVALALARPWGQGAIVGSLGAPLSRDVVFVLDGSGSMDWRGGGETPHHRAVQWIHEAIEEFRPGDTVSLIDARSQPRLVVERPTSDYSIVREELAKLPAPSGSSDLVRSISAAARILSATANVSREIIVLTDNQALPWRLDEEFAWARLDELLRQPEVSPSIHAVLFEGQGERTNFSVDRLELSRDLTVPGFPLRIRTSIRQSGGSATQKSVALEIDGQRVLDKTRQVTLLPDGEALVEFEHVFPSRGSYVASVVIDEDNLPVDDRSDAVITVTSGVPALLVDGDPSLDETRTETFFIRSVFHSSGVESPWVKGTVIRADELDASRLAESRVVFLCNVAALREEQWELLADHVALGGGLVVAPGNKLNSRAWNRLNSAGGPPLLPARFGSLGEEAAQAEQAVTVDSQSLEDSWLRRFRKESGVDFWQTRFSKWWELDLIEPEEPIGDGGDVESERPQGPLVIARLSNGAPLMIAAPYGDGTVLQLAVPLDADWSTLPARSDFVPFLHEMVFLLSPGEFPRNVDVGTPLRLPLADDETAGEYLLDGPGIEGRSLEQRIERTSAVASFAQTAVPGVYRFYKPRNRAGSTEPFVVDEDRSESDLTPLTEVEWATLTEAHGVQPAATMSELTAARLGEVSRTELWWALLLLVLLLLIAEVALTRNMVQGGHAVLEREAGEA